MTPAETPSATSPTPELVRGTFADFSELCRIEIALARNELVAELGRAKQAAIALVVGCLLLCSALTLLVVAGVLAQGDPSRSALVAGGIAIGLGLGLLIWARSRAPKSLLTHTRRRLEDDVTLLKGTAR
jgi:hypothetical protein